MNNLNVYELSELTPESSFTSYGYPEIISGCDEVYDALFEDNDYVVIMNLDIGQKFIDSEDNLWVRIR